MSISSILNIAKNAFYAFQTSLQVTSHNIANVSTKGYSKKEAVLSEATPLLTSIGLLGDGVRVTRIISYYDKYLENMIVEKRTNLEQATVTENYFSRIESIFNEDNSKLSDAITEFFNSWQELSLDPLSLSARMQVLLKGESLGSRIRYMYENLKNTQLELNQKVGLEVEEINRILSSIAELNLKIFEGGLTSSEAGDYIDQRTELLKELSGKLKIQSFEDSEGRITVLTEKGQILVDGGNYWNLRTINDNDTGFYKVGWEDKLGNVSDITDHISAGKIKALIMVRDSTIPDFIDDLDELAQSLMDDVNGLHENGYNMNGGTGIAFFVGSSSKDMDVNSEIKENVRLIAHTSDYTNEPGGNDITLSIAALGSSYTDSAARLVSTAGGLVQAAKDTFTFEKETMTILEKQRESVSGVSIDEEMANLIKFQYAYQAAARLFTVADELFKALLEAV